MKLPLREFFRPQVIFPVPTGMTGDVTGALGLLGFMQNANAYAEQLSSVATAGTNTTLIPSQLLSGVVQLNSGASGPFTITLPSTGSIISGLPSTIPMDGSYTEHVAFKNNLTGQPATLVAGDSGTNIDVAVIGSNVTRFYLMRVLGSSTISLTNLGALPL